MFALTTTLRLRTQPLGGFRVNAELIKAIAELIGASGLLTIAWRVAPIVADRVQLILALNAAEARARRAEELLDAYQTMSERWELVHAEMQQMRSQLGSSIIYIGDILMHVREGGAADAMPPVPDDLKEAVELSMKRRDAMREAAAAVEA